MIDLSDAVRDMIELIEATEEKERARAAKIVLKHVVKLGEIQLEESALEIYAPHELNDLLIDIASQIMAGE